jgi:hypothetical protein
VSPGFRFGYKSGILRVPGPAEQAAFRSLAKPRKSSHLFPDSRTRFTCKQKSVGVQDFSMGGDGLEPPTSCL